jgi:hypothetical protein
MTESIKPVTCNSEEIKRQLDRAYGYVIFEKSIQPGEEAGFQQVLAVLKQFDLNPDEFKFLRDENRGILLLLVRFDPSQTNRIVQEFLNIGLPDGITFYAYGSPMAG